jgi:hypothetical protein
LARNSTSQWNVDSEPRDEGDALVWIDANLMTKAVAESPDDQVFAPSILERLRLGVAREIAEGVARKNWQTLVAMVQRAATRHHNEISSWKACLCRRDDQHPGFTL